MTTWKGGSYKVRGESYLRCGLYPLGICLREKELYLHADLARVFTVALCPTGKPSAGERTNDVHRGIQRGEYFYVSKKNK